MCLETVEGASRADFLEGIQWLTISQGGGKLPDLLAIRIYG